MSAGHLAIVTDVTLAEWIGGGTLVNDYLARCAEAAGWRVSTIRIQSALNEWPGFAHDTVDAYFVANIPFMPVDAMLQLVNSKKPYVMFRHDISSICYEADPPSHTVAKLLHFLFENAAANFFISPLQLAYYQRVCPVVRPITVPPPLDLGAFANAANPTRSGHLYLGEIASARGVDESLRLMAQSGAPGPKSLYGQVAEPALEALANGLGATCHAAIAHTEVPALLNRYQHFYYHPRIIDAFCLKVVEAELCGMELHVNQAHIGRFGFRESAQELADFMRQHSAAMILQALSR